MTDEFYRTQLGEPYVDVALSKLMHDAGCEYHTLCDAHDLSVCSDKSRGGTPHTVEERVACNEHAKRVRSEIQCRYGLTDKEMQRAIVNYKGELYEG